jgi:predicted nucleotidyltransferase
MDSIITDYIERLTSVHPGIKSIWLFGSRANNSYRSRSDSDWDLLVFADQNTFNELKRDKTFHRDKIDLLVVFNENEFEMPWPDEKGAKHGSLKNWKWIEISNTEATYKSVKYRKEDEWFKENMLISETLKSIKIWPSEN